MPTNGTSKITICALSGKDKIHIISLLQNYVCVKLIMSISQTRLVSATEKNMHSKGYGLGENNN